MSSQNEEPWMPVASVVRDSSRKLRVGPACAFLKQDGAWGYSNPSDNVLEDSAVRDEILTALMDAGPRHEYYTLSLNHFIVLYPEYVTREDLLTSIQPSDFPDGSKMFYSIWAELPFRHGKQRVQIIVDPEQEEPLVTSLDDLERHVF